MPEIPTQRTARTALAQLLDAHRGLIKGGFQPQAQVLATALLDRVNTTDGGGGVIARVSTAEGLVIADRVINSAAPDLRHLVRSIVLGI